MSLKKFGYLPYDKEELSKKINKIDICRKDTNIITKYDGRVINITEVSDKYEIFDIKSFLIEKINLLESNFTIHYYKFSLRGGVQQITLLSDSVDINGAEYYKSFFILNSSDRSRRLNMNLGLYRSDNNSYLISSSRNISINRKHIRGISKLVEESVGNIDIETFSEQIENIKSLVNQSVMLSNLRNIIIDKDLKINHSKFDAFKNQLLYSSTDKISDLTRDQRIILNTYSKYLELTSDNDFPIDAYKAFNCYIQVFSRQDSHIVKKETERILKITNWFIRNEKISEILDLL